MTLLASIADLHPDGLADLDLDSWHFLVAHLSGALRCPRYAVARTLPTWLLGVA